MDKNTAAPFKISTIHQAFQQLFSAKKVTLLTHFRPDGDGMSICAALDEILHKKGIKVETIYPTHPDVNIKRQARTILINNHKQIPDIIVAADTSNYERLYYPSAFNNIPLINIDHHISNTIQGTFNFVDHTTSSTGELMTTLLLTVNEKLINSYVAHCLLYSILYDTSVFVNQSTSARTLKIAAYLIEKGAQLFPLQQELMCNKNPQIIRLWGRILDSIQISRSGKAAWAVIRADDLQKFNVTLSALVGFNNFISHIAEIDISILFYQTEDGKTKVSLRSKKSDVNKIAQKFGGGGHKNAAGILSDIPLDTLVEEITKDL